VQRFVASLLALAIAVVFTMNMTGCSESKKKTTTTAPAAGEAKKFAAEKGEGEIKAKDGTFEATFKEGDPKSVDPKEKDGVSAEVKEKKVIFTWKGELPDADKTAEFTVKGGKEDKEEVKIKITVKKKA